MRLVSNKLVFAFAGVMAAWGFAKPALADRGTYVVSEGCPPFDQFARQVSARTPQFQILRETRETPAVEIVHREGTPHFLGKLTIKNADGTESVREVPGDTCDEVVSALSLVTALAIDPHATTAPLPPAPPPAQEPPQATPVKDERPKKIMVLERFGMGAHAAFHTGVAPNTLMSVPIFLEARSSGANGWFRPTLRVAFEHGLSVQTQVSASGSAEFSWNVGTLEFCPSRWSIASTLDVTPCLRGEIGVLGGAGSSIEPSRSRAPLWLGVGVPFRLQWHIFGSMFVDLESGPRFALLRTRYFFQPDITVFRPPAVGIFGAAGVGVHFL